MDPNKKAVLASYQRELARCRDRVEHLIRILDKLEHDPPDRLNYGAVGDLAHVAEELGEILCFLE